MKTEKKKYLLHLAIYMLVITVLFYLTELARFAAPLFSFVYYATFNQMFVIIIKIIIYTLIIAFSLSYSNKHFKIKVIYKENESFPLKRQILVYSIVVFAILIISAALGFKVKPAVDIGENVSGPNWVTTLVKFLMQIIRMGIVVILIRHGQEFFEVLIDKEFSKKIPFGGVVSFLLMGIGTLFLDGVSIVNIILLFYHFLYGGIYLLNYKYFPYTYVCCFLIQLL